MSKDRTKWFGGKDMAFHRRFCLHIGSNGFNGFFLPTNMSYTINNHFDFYRCKINNYNWYNQFLLLILTFIFITFNSYRCFICKILKFSFGLFILQKSKNDIQSLFFQKTPKNGKSINLKTRSKVQAKSTPWPSNEYFKKWFNFLIFRYLSIKSLKMG